MDYKLSVFADCQNDCVRISVDTINMKIVKQQQQKQQEQKQFKVSGKCHKDMQQMEADLFKKTN